MFHEPKATPRARRHDANLQRILEAAMDMVAGDGLEGLSMTRLAAAVDYTPGALYRYFDSKDAILSKLVERILEEVRAGLDRSVARLPAKASPLAHVVALVDGYRAFARAEPRRFGLLAMTMADPRVLLQQPKDAEPVARAILAAMQPLGVALGQAAEVGQLSGGDVAERTLCLFAMLQGVLLLQKQARRAPGVLDVDRLAIGGTRTLLVGWGAKPRAVDAAVARAIGSRRPGGAS